MDNIEVFTEDLRNELVDYKDELTKKYEHDVDILGDNISFEDEVYIKLYKDILSSRYKNILNLIILNDTYEFAKTEKIKDEFLDENELEALSFIETKELNDIFKKLEKCDDFLITVLTLFFAYHASFIKEQRDENRKILESINDTTLHKFLIFMFDSLQYEYRKRRN